MKRMECINIKIICEKPVHAEIIDYVLKVGIMNLEKEFIKEVIGYEEWNGKLNAQIEIKELKCKLDMRKEDEEK